MREPERKLLLKPQFVSCAPSSSRDTISDSRMEKAEGLFEYGKPNGAGSRSDDAASRCVAALAELPVALAIAVGAFVRPSAVLMFLYTLGTALIGHRYWTTTGAERVDTMDSFYKNLSIMGGFLLLYITGAGKYSIDGLFRRTAP